MSDRLGIIAPHPPIIVSAVGGLRSKGAQATIDGLEEARSMLAASAPEAIVIMSPHAPALADAFVVDDSEVHSGSLGSFGDDTVRQWAGDPALAHAITSALDASGIPALARTTSTGMQPGVLDHGVVVPLSFLDPEQRLPLVVMSLSGLDYGAHRALGQAVAQAAASVGRRVAFVASGDLSHRLTPDAPAGYSERASDLDEAIVGLVRRGRFEDLLELNASLVAAGGECGLRPIIALGGFLGDDPVPTRVLSYEGPWGVGYLAALAGALAAEQPEGLVAAESGGSTEAEIVALARRAIESYVREGQRLRRPTLHGEYPQQAGAFVSLHRGGALRGCVGTIVPTRPSLAEEVAANAVQAAVADPRFGPLAADELHDLEVKVDVLHPPESCSIEDLDPQRYGLIASSGARRGLLLPDLEGVDDVETQIAVTLRKAGIGPDEPCGFERFRVDRYT